MICGVACLMKHGVSQYWGALWPPSSGGFYLTEMPTDVRKLRDQLEHLNPCWAPLLGIFSREKGYEWCKWRHRNTHITDIMRVDRALIPTAPTSGPPSGPGSGVPAYSTRLPGIQPPGVGRPWAVTASDAQHKPLSAQFSPFVFPINSPRGCGTSPASARPLISPGGVDRALL